METKKILNILAWIWLILVIIWVWVRGFLYCSIATCLSYSCGYNFLDSCCACSNLFGFIFRTIVYGLPSWILFLIARKIKLKRKRWRN